MWFEDASIALDDGVVGDELETGNSDREFIKSLGNDVFPVSLEMVNHPEQV